MTFDEWVRKNLGRGIDWDGVYGVQCVDLVNHYIYNVLGIRPVMIGNAIEFYRKRNSSTFLKNNFTWISNTPSFVPKKGDIGVFKTKSGFGHVCVANGVGTTSYFYSYDQNYPLSRHEPMTKIRHTYPNFLGVLRPKKALPTNTDTANAKKYFKRYTGKSISIVDSLKAIGARADYAYCKRIAAKNGIRNYRGTPAQNLKMLAMLKKGTLLIP